MDRLMKIGTVMSLIALASLASCTQKAKMLQRYNYTHKSMGTIFRIICFAEGQELPDSLSFTAFKRLDDLNNIMSDYLPDSELNLLSRQSGSGEYVEVGPELFKILSISYHWAERTNGIFDITVGPYSQLWRRAGRKELLPTSEQIEKASESVGYKYIRLDPDRQRVRLIKEGMQLDLGGIAKGYAVDELFGLFKNAGIHRVLVDGGGDIRTGDPPPGSKGWKIVLENLDKKDQMIFQSNTAIATSGDLYRYVVIDSVRYSHIIDPRTGYGLTFQKTVTVQASTCTDADVLASALSIWEPKEGLEFLSTIPDTKAIVLLDDHGAIKRFEKGKLNYKKN